MNSHSFIRPFERYGERQLLTVGGVGLVVGSLIGYFCKMRYDGVIDAHISKSIVFYQPFVDNLINVFSLLLPLLVLGYWINRKTRPVDVLTVALFARFPMYLLPLFNLSGTLERATDRAMDTFLTGKLDLHWADTAILVGAGFLGLAALVYSIILLYQGFCVATNLKKPVHRVAFAFAFILAVVLSKLLIINIAY